MLFCNSTTLRKSDWKIVYGPLKKKRKKSIAYWIFCCCFFSIEENNLALQHLTSIRCMQSIDFFPPKMQWRFLLHCAERWRKPFPCSSVSAAVFALFLLLYVAAEMWNYDYFHISVVCTYTLTLFLLTMIWPDVVLGTFMILKDPFSDLYLHSGLQWSILTWFTKK